RDGKDRITISIKDILSNIKKIQRFCMEQYGWTLTEVRKQPYVKLLEILNEENKEETEEKQSEQKVITGTDLRKLFGS
ncbi:hypothetical protein, partial [Escherichia coli]